MDLAVLVEPERVVAVLDDLGEMYDQAAEVFGDSVPILRLNAWNAGLTRPRMVSELDVAATMIDAQIADWKIRHNFDSLPTTK
jgi:hypothetical protein